MSAGFRSHTLRAVRPTAPASLFSGRWGTQSGQPSGAFEDANALGPVQEEGSNTQGGGRPWLWTLFSLRALRRWMLLGAPGPLVSSTIQPLSALDCCINALPRGVSQVCFMDNSLVGAVAFIALTAPLPAEYAILCAIGLLSSTLIAFALLPGGPQSDQQLSQAQQENIAGWSRKPIPAISEGWRHGLFGFNGMLVGAAMATFSVNRDSVDGPLSSKLVFSSIATVFASSIATLLSFCLGNCWKGFQIPTFTMPFNLSTLIIIAALAAWNAGAGGHDLLVSGPHMFYTSGIGPSGGISGGGSADLNITTVPAFHACFGSTPSSLAANGNFQLDGPAPSNADCTGRVLAAVFRGIAQVYFCDSWASGLVLFLAFALASPIGAVASFLGSGTGLAVGIFLGADATFCNEGLLGYNGVIAAMAICGVFYKFSFRTLLLAIWTAAIATCIQACMRVFFLPIGLPVLTLPFCLSAILVLGAGIHWPSRVTLANAGMAEDHVSVKWLRKRRKPSTSPDPKSVERNAVHPESLDRLENGTPVAAVVVSTHTDVSGPRSPQPNVVVEETQENCS